MHARNVALLLLTLAACERAPAAKKASQEQPVASTVADASTPKDSGGLGNAARDAGPPREFVGVVRGVVKLAQGARLPLAPPILVNGSAPIAVAPCPPVDLTDRKTIAADEASRGLSPVHLAVTGMSVSPQRDPRVHELYIDACRIRPTLVGAMRGDTIRVVNRSDTPLLPALPGDKFMQAIVRGDAREFTVKLLGPNPVSCSFANYCGESSIITLSHPLYAVTDAQGSYTIERVPLDEELTLHAWHPLFEVTSVPFKLSHEEREKQLELTLTPTASAVESEPKKGKAPPPGKSKKKPQE